ncbi:MAG: shikimate kinase AroK [Gammaproteobacteria bacterium]|nr:shikimate kinase AroK [Gammaproteobacteria bacterium]
MSRKNVFLVGLMAVGKTTVGRLLAQALSAEFVDSDQVIEERAGANIAWIFDVEGEQGFRDREEQVIDELTQKQGIVLATGGGVALRACNRRILVARGVVVHLDSPLERLVERTQRDKKRPLLQQGDLRETLATLQADRGPLYEEIADYRFVTDRQGPKVLARMIEKKLREDGAI